MTDDKKTKERFAILKVIESNIFIDKKLLYWFFKVQNEITYFRY